MVSDQVPEIVVARLPLYLRSLVNMAAEGKDIVSSQELGARLGISSAQIRKDLSQFGEFGKQGTGYHIASLISHLKRILKVEHVWDVALVGVGDLGRALAHYGGFMDRGFRIACLFDKDPSKIGTQIGELEIQDAAHMVDVIRTRGIRVAMLTVPRPEAQGAAERLVEAGVRAILCYAPKSLRLSPDIRIQYIDPVLRLQQMTYYL